MVLTSCARFFRLTVLLLGSGLVCGCGIIREKKQPGVGDIEIAEQAVTNPMSPEETEAMMGDVASNWFYGQGLGETALAVGTVVLFPPYALYLAGNAVLSLSGYEEVRVSQALPDSGEDIWNSVYDGVTSVPGRVTSGVSGREYVTRNAAEDTLNKYLKRNAQDSTHGSVKAWQSSD